MRARAHTHFLDFLFHFVCLHFVPGFEPASDRWWTLAASQQPMLSATAEYSITRFVCRSCEQQERDSMRKKKKAKQTTTAVSSRSSNGSSSNSEYNIFETNMFRWKLWQLLSCAISFFASLLLLFSTAVVPLPSSPSSCPNASFSASFRNECTSSRFIRFL